MESNHKQYPEDTSTEAANQQPKEADSSTLLTVQRPASAGSHHQPDDESLFIASCKRQPPDISAPDMFTGGSPLGLNLSIEEPPSLTLKQRFRRRLPSRPTVVMFLACVAFWLCGVVFGVFALLLEFHARYMAQTGSLDDRKKSHRLRKASCVVSIVGIVVGSVAVIAVVCGLMILEQHRRNYYNNYVLHEDVCEKFQGICYRFKGQLSCANCLARQGIYDKGYCYHNNYECPGYETSQSVYPSDKAHCFASRRLPDGTQCLNGYYDSNDGYCYFTPTPDCDGYFVGCACYIKYSSNYTEGTCESIGGFYNKVGGPTYSRTDGTQVITEDSTCYYNSFDCRDHLVDGQCYANRSTGYTSGTCQNIGGYMDHSTGYCYHNGFNYCPGDLQYQGQCYNIHIPTTTCTSCMNTGGELERKPYMHGGYLEFECYYYESNQACPYFLVSTRIQGRYSCELNRSSAHDEQQCEELDGIYSNGSCYYTPSQCANYTYKCNCYNYRSTFAMSTCKAYDGKYDFARSWCFYNSTICRYYTFKNACYRSQWLQNNNNNNNDWKDQCHGAFDDFNKICYQ